MSTLVIQPSFRAVGQTHVEWQTFENPENKRQLYGSQASTSVVNRTPPSFLSYFTTFIKVTKHISVLRERNDENWERMDSRAQCLLQRERTTGNALNIIRVYTSTWPPEFVKSFQNSRYLNFNVLRGLIRSLS